MAADPADVLALVIGAALARVVAAVNAALAPLATATAPAAAPAGTPPAPPAAAAAPAGATPPPAGAAAPPAAPAAAAAANQPASRSAGGLADLLRTLGDLLGSGIGRLVSAVEALARHAGPAGGAGIGASTATGLSSLQSLVVELLAETRTAVGLANQVATHLGVISVAVTAIRAILQQPQPPPPTGAFGGGTPPVTTGGLAVTTTGPAPAAAPAEPAEPATGGLLSALGSLALTAQAAVAAVQGAVSAVQGFVAALNPGLILNFQLALDNLRATVGVAFQPVFEVLISVFRQVGGIILPLMEALRPVVQQVSEIFAADFIPAVKLVVDIIEALLPVVQVLITVLEAVDAALRPGIALASIVVVSIGAIFSALAAVLQPVVAALQVFSAIMDSLTEVLDIVAVIFRVLATTMTATIAALFGTDIKGLLASIASVTKQVITALLVFVATLLHFFGADKALAGLIDALKPKTGAVAAGPVGIKGFEQIGKDLALASAQAAGNAGEEKKADLGDVIKTLEGIKDGTDAGNSKLVSVLEQIEEVLKTIAHPGDALGGAASGAARRLRENRFLNPFGI